MAQMKRWFCCLLGTGWLVSCGTPPVLEVRPTHLRSIQLEDIDDAPMVRGEQQRLLHGAIGIREQEQRLGHYYVIEWNDDQVGEPVKVKFEYQQGGTGSKVKVQQADFGPSETSGRAEFRIIGQDYLKGGRVLAWRCTLTRGGREIASRRSYLWQ
jgi:hypothetical protein